MVVEEVTIVLIVLPPRILQNMKSGGLSVPRVAAASPAAPPALTIRIDLIFWRIRFDILEDSMRAAANLALCAMSILLRCCIYIPVLDYQRLPGLARCKMESDACVLFFAGALTPRSNISHSAPGSQGALTGMLLYLSYFLLGALSLLPFSPCHSFAHFAFEPMFWLCPASLTTCARSSGENRNNVGSHRISRGNCAQLAEAWTAL